MITFQVIEVNLFYFFYLPLKCLTSKWETRPGSFISDILHINCKGLCVQSSHTKNVGDTHNPLSSSASADKTVNVHLAVDSVYVQGKVHRDNIYMC